MKLWAGLNFVHAVAQAWDAGKLFHIGSQRSGPGPLRSGFPLWRRESGAGPFSS